MNRDPAQHPHIISKRKSEPTVTQNAPKRQNTIPVILCRKHQQQIRARDLAQKNAKKKEQNTQQISCGPGTIPAQHKQTQKKVTTRKTSFNRQKCNTYNFWQKPAATN